MRMAGTQAGPARAGRGGGRGRPPHGAPLHRRRDARRSARADPARAVEGRHRVLARPARRGHGDRRPRRTATRPAAATRSTRSAGPPPGWPRAARARAGLARAAAAREPVGEGVRADARCCARRRPTSAATTPPARMRPLLRQARELGAHLHIDMESLDTLEATTGAGLRAARRGGVRATGPRRGSCCRPTCASRPRSSIACSTGRRATRAPPAARGPAGEGRLLGPRDRGGAPARLDAARVRGEGGLRPQLRGAHAAPAGGARRRCGSAIASHNLRSVAHAIACDRAAGRRGPRPRAAGAARPRRRARRRRWPPQRHARARSTARSATWWPAWPTSCAACSRTPPTSRSCTSRRAACRSRSCWPRREPAAVRERAGRWSCAGRRSRDSLVDALRELDAAAAAARAGADRRRRRGPTRASSPPIRARPRASWPARAAATRGDAAAAVEAAERGVPRLGARRPAAERAEVLRGAAASLRERRLELAALQVRECAKPWAEADADVCEAIDFLEYYARAGARARARAASCSRCRASATRCATCRAAWAP